MIDTKTGREKGHGIQNSLLPHLTSREGCATLCGLCQLQMSSCALVKQQPFTCVPWRKKWISINARRSSSPSDSWLEPDEPLSDSLGVILSFAGQKKLSMLRCWRRRALHAQCSTFGERGGGLKAPGYKRGGCSKDESYSRTAMCFIYLTNTTRYLSHSAHGRAQEKLEVTTNGSLWYKNIGGKKGGVELHVFAQWTQTNKTKWPRGARQAAALQLKPHRNRKLGRCSSGGLKTDADVCWRRLVAAGVVSQQI